MKIPNGSKIELLRELNQSIKKTRTIKDPNLRFLMYNYISNLYTLLNEMNIPVKPNYKRIFNGEFDKFDRLVVRLGDKFDENFIRNKDFHQEYLGHIFSTYQDFVVPTIDTPVYDESDKFSKDDFFTVLHDFLASIGKEEEFDKLFSSNRIYKTRYDKSNTLMGSTVYNPSNGICRMSVDQAEYTFNTLYTLVHELGHFMDLEDMYRNNSPKDMISYRYLTIYDEVYSKTMEKLLFHYMYQNDIKVGVVDDKIIDDTYGSYTFLFSTILHTYLPDQVLERGLYQELDSDEFSLLLRTVRGEDKSADQFIKMGKLCLPEDITYTYGEVLSTFFSDLIIRGEIDSSILTDFRKGRIKPFNRSFIEDNGLTPEKHKEIFTSKTSKILERKRNSI